MLVVPRNVRKLPALDREEPASSPVTVQALRDQPAWVLLGEPGAGKSTTFEMEAEAVGGRFLRIDEFIHTEPAEELRGTPLFLDGLDEVRAGGDSILLRARTQLKKLGNPPFRIACRAADWFGSTDCDDLRFVSPGGTLPVYILEPLTDKDMAAILRENHGISDPQAFIEKARELGVADLLENPKALELLVRAVGGNQWPTSRRETYQLACEKLVTEPNKRHRNKQRGDAISPAQLLDAAGYLSAALLLSDKAGIALDSEQVNERYPQLADYAPSDMAVAERSVRSMLFRASPEGEERVIPSHRSVAEYLAATWLAERIDSRGLPLGRVLNLLLGNDGRTVAGLRGLYGWLALCCREARTRLIEADPFTVVVYGDVKPMPPADKHRIIAGLRREVECYPALYREVSRSAHAFGGLADPKLVEDFRKFLESSDRDEAAQCFAGCMLEILCEGEVLPELRTAVKDIILDETRWGGVRAGALQAWLKMEPEPLEASVLLDAISDGKVSDNDDELTGLLLEHLYPRYLPPQNLLRHLHPPKNDRLLGKFYLFWSHDLPQDIPESHLPILLDALVRQAESLSSESHHHFLDRVVGRLLVKGIKMDGDGMTNERLFDWLGLGVDKHADPRLEEDERRAIAAWFQDRPERYKAMLALCFQRCEGHENPGYCLHLLLSRLCGAEAPKDIGIWHLDQASLAGDAEIARLHLSKAVEALMYRNDRGGLSLEQIEAWAEAHPQRKQLLDPLLAWEITGWRKEESARAKKRRERHAAERRERSIRLNNHLAEIRAGIANVGVMHELACVWMPYHSGVGGNTPVERFERYCENGREILAAAEAGFMRCTERSDLPTVEEIIGLKIKQREHYIRLPCLAGMELRWRQGASSVQSLPDDALRRMIVFRLTYGAGNPPDWFLHLVAEHPALVAEVLVEHAMAAFRSKQDFVDGIYQLATDPRYFLIANAAVPRLLDRFPVRAKPNQLNHLESLLKAALRYSMALLPEIVTKKLKLKAMDASQRVYWLAAGMLMDPAKYEETLWRYIGKSWVRVNALSGFLGERFSGLTGEYSLSAGTLSKLIELLAPHAELDWPRGGGRVTEAINRGDQVRSMSVRLGAMGTEEAAMEIERLLAMPSLKKLRLVLEDARYQLRLKQRENEFRFPPLSDITHILANGEPVSATDLVAMALDHLDDLARKIRGDNVDGFHAFWNVENKQPKSQREENLCRDVLLSSLRAQFKPHGVDCQPEGDYFNDKRADIRLSYRNSFEVPIEVKRDSNPSLWTALRDQLIAQYSISPNAMDHGIYLVLWFGGQDMPSTRDGGKKPRSAEELASRLEAQLDASERKHVFVRVLDVSWPS